MTRRLGDGMTRGQTIDRGTDDDVVERGFLLNMFHVRTMGDVDRVKEGAIVLGVIRTSECERMGFAPPICFFLTFLFHFMGWSPV